MKIKFIDNTTLFCIEPLYPIIENTDIKCTDIVWIESEIFLNADSLRLHESVSLCSSDFKSLLSLFYKIKEKIDFVSWKSLEDTIHLEITKKEEMCYYCELCYVTNLENNNYVHISFVIYESDIDDNISKLCAILDWINMCILSDN